MIENMYSCEGYNLYLPVPVGYGFLWRQPVGPNTIEEIVGYSYKGEVPELRFITKSGIEPKIIHPNIVGILTPEELYEATKPKFFKLEKENTERKMCPYYMATYEQEGIPFVITWGEYQEKERNPKFIEKGTCLKTQDWNDCNCYGCRERCECE